jgi:hypothetical protein
MMLSYVILFGITLNNTKRYHVNKQVGFPGLPDISPAGISLWEKVMSNRLRDSAA